MKKFKKEIGHRLYVSTKKKNQLTQRNERQERALVTLTVHVHRHGVSVVPLHYNRYNSYYNYYHGNSKNSLVNHSIWRDIQL